MATVDGVLNVARAHLGEGESPPGSNVTSFGAWYGMNGVSWCAEFVSFCLTRGGFNDGADHIAIPGVSADTSKGWAYVPDIVAAAQRAGRFDRSPRVGDVVTYYWSGDGNPGDSHTGLVESVNADGSFNTIEGNEGNQVERQHRPLNGQVKGFFHPPYAAATPSPQEDDMTRDEANYVLKALGQIVQIVSNLQAAAERDVTELTDLAQLKADVAAIKSHVGA